MNAPTPCGYCQFEDDNGVMCRAPIPPGYVICADCFDALPPRPVGYPNAIDVTPTPRRPLGRWVPWLVFTIMVIVTLTNAAMAFWMLILIPAFAMGWMFGFGPGREVEHYQADMHPDMGAADWHPNNSPWNQT